MRFCRSLLFGAVALVSASVSVAQATKPAIVHFSTSNVIIRTHRGVQRFVVEVARSPEEQERGLMYRTRIAPHTGMIFPMSPPHTVAFWMKNCPIPEDMIFVSTDGRIESIAQNTKPNSEIPIASGGSVIAVLEVAGGETAKLGIKPGDKVEWARQ